jgi:glycosyltransferase involved in cell wall biosynthesis
MQDVEAWEQGANALRGRDLVVFSNDWDGDPLSKTHIMRILSRDNRILWVDSLGNRAPKLNGHDVLRVYKKLSGFADGVREVEPNLFVLSPLAIPLYGSTWAKVANRVLLRAQVQRAMQRLGFSRPISWTFLPAAAPVVGTLGEELVVYHCVDEFSAFSDANGQHIAELERGLLRRADVVITSAERLRASKAPFNPNTVLVRHGVDFRHFVQACDPATSVPDDLARLSKPVMGFFGLLADWVDLEAIACCARAYPQGSVVLIGKQAPGVNAAPLLALSNVHFLGRRAYAELPRYCRGFDVALMPFRLNELTLNANPLKVREYLAAGLPVVASDLPEVRKVGFCKVASNSEDFPRRVQECLDEGPGPDRVRAQRVLPESWEARVDDIRRHIGQTQLQMGLST